MRIGPLGTKEIVALGLLLVAAFGAIAVTFLRDEDAAQDEAALQVQADRTAGITPGAATATPSPTPLPPISAVQPSGWQITFQAITSTGNAIDDGFNAVEKLDLKYDSVPFLTMTDNMWGVRALGQLKSDRGGAWKFSIEYKGSIKVFINDQLVGEGQSDSLTTLDVEGPATGASGVVIIEARDTGGPFVLRWK